METALAALNEHNDTDLEVTDVQEILLAYREPRHLRGEQRVNRGYRLVTGRTSGGKPYRDEGHLTYTLSHLSRERTLDKSMPKGKQVPRDGEEAKTSFFVYFGGEHSTPCYVGKGVIDTGCSRFLIGQNTLENWERMKVKLEKVMTFRCGNVAATATHAAVVAVVAAAATSLVAAAVAAAVPAVAALGAAANALAAVLAVVAVAVVTAAAIATAVSVVVDSAAGTAGAADAVCAVVALMPLPPLKLMSSVFGTVLQFLAELLLFLVMSQV